MKFRVLSAIAIATSVFSIPFATAQVNTLASETVSVAASSSESYIVTFAEEGLMYYNGGRVGFPATAPSFNSRKLQAKSPDAVAYRSLLRSQQDAYVAQMASALSHPLVASHNYDVTMSGVAVVLTAAEAARIRTIPGVKSVTPAGTYELATDAGPAWIGAPAIWNGPGTPTNVGTRGQGVVVGIFDSGANQDHPSFANDALCGFSAASPKVIGFKDCLANQCVGGDPEDTSTASGGHGVHTASTVAGNALTPPLNVGGVELKWPISGVAPCARVITYKVCGTNTCDGTAIQQAIQQSIVDQVDVVNYSISGGNNPWTDSDRGFLDMVNGDILVAASAGNTRAAPNDIATGAVNHRGPWVLTVANSTHDRVEGNSISLSGSLQAQPGAPSAAPTFTVTTTAQIITGASLGNNFGCTDTGAFPAGSMTGRIALIQRGPLTGATPACAFTEKLANASAAGAIGAVIYNHSPGPLVNIASSAIPGFFVRKEVGEAWLAAATANPSAQFTIVAPATRITNPAFGDILNASSLRGPNIVGSTTVGTNTYLGSDTTKPDITGPGTNIYAAVSDIAGQFGFLTGTSMSSPHLAGGAALIRAANPTWTPTEVKSALMLTAKASGLKPTETAPWDLDDVGSGRIDLNRAAKSGLVMNETFANFLAANPTATGNQTAVRALNLPAYRNTSCTGGVCTFTRTFRSTRATTTTWTINTTGAPTGTTITATPSTFDLAAGATQTVSFEVRITQAGGIVMPAGQTPNYGVITFTDSIVTTIADAFFFNGFEDARVGTPLRFTVAIAGPQAP
jgi:subtilisin family serine protease